jgi:hypothetical protein
VRDWGQKRKQRAKFPIMPKEAIGTSIPLAYPIDTLPIRKKAQGVKMAYRRQQASAKKGGGFGLRLYLHKNRQAKSQIFDQKTRFLQLL